MKTIGIYAGCFDPITAGHLDIIKRSMKFCDTLYVAIGINPAKQTMFSAEERIKQINTVLDDIYNDKSQANYVTNVKVDSFQGLLVDYAKSINAKVLIRGIRSVSDFEYEINLSNVNRVLNKEIETVFLPTSPELAVISSSMVKEISKHGGDISRFVPKNIAKDVVGKFGFEKTGYTQKEIDEERDKVIKESKSDVSVIDTKIFSYFKKSESKRVAFPEFECGWCGENTCDGSFDHMCSKTPRIKLNLYNQINDFYTVHKTTEYNPLAPEAFKEIMQLVLAQIPEEESTLNSLVAKFSVHPYGASDCRACVLQLKADGKISLDEKGMIRKL